MKMLLRIAAVLAFLFPFTGGLVLFSLALSSSGGRGEGSMLGVIGSFFVGNAFFVGAMLLAASEKAQPK